MKKKILTVMILSLLLVACLAAFVACNKEGTAAVTKPDSKQVYSISAVSSVMYLSAEHTGYEGGIASTSRPDGVTETTVTDVKTYLLMFEDMLTGGVPKITESAVDPTIDVEYADYATKLSITVGEETYTMYYTEHAKNNADKVVDDDDEEIETTLNGVIVYGTEKYIVIGEKEIDPNDNEIEIEFTTKSAENPTDYIIVEQEIERNEISYEYTIVENGREVSSKEIEYGTDRNGRFKVEFEIEVSGVEKEVEVTAIDDYSFRVEYEQDGMQDLEMTVTKVAEETGEGGIVISQAGFTFTYKNGYSEFVAI